MDYFSEWERPFQQALRKWRDTALIPLIDGLSRIGVTANHVTFTGLLFLLVSVSVGPDHAWVPIVCLTVYCLLDGVDGPLARRTGKASQGGALLDMVMDQMGLVVITAAAVHYLSSHGPLAVLFACSYIGVIVLLLYARELAVWNWPVIRVKYFFYGVYGLSFLLDRDLITPVFLLATPYYLVMFALVMAALYTRLKDEP